MSADTVGALRIGRPLAEIVARCGGALPMWDFGDEGIPSPVLVVRMGSVHLELMFDDTLPGGTLASIVTSDTTARTSAGVGPGSSFTALRRAYGDATLIAGECSLYADFASAPGLSFGLDSGGALECDEITGIAEGNAASRLPASTRVRKMVVFSARSDL